MSSFINPETGSTTTTFYNTDGQPVERPPTNGTGIVGLSNGNKWKFEIVNGVVGEPQVIGIRASIEHQLKIVNEAIAAGPPEMERKY